MALRTHESWLVLSCALAIGCQGNSSHSSTTGAAGAGAAEAGAGGGAGGAGTTGGSSGGAGGSPAGSGGGAGSEGGAPSREDGGDASADTGAFGGPIKVLLVNHTAGYGHQSRLTAIPLLMAAAAANNIDLDLRYAHTTMPGKTPLPEGTNDSATPPDLSAFTPGGLDHYDVVFFLNTTGNVFQGATESVHQQALQDFIDQRHGGFVGAHSAADTYDDRWPWYQDMMGAIYSGHSNVVAGTVRMNPGATSVILTEAMVPDPWQRMEEWYTYRRDVRQLTGFTALLLANAPLPTGGVGERPSAWVHEVPGGGRAFYTGFGHFVAAFQEEAVMRLLMAGVKWAAHRTD